MGMANRTSPCRTPRPGRCPLTEATTGRRYGPQGPCRSRTRQASRTSTARLAPRCSDGNARFPCRTPTPDTSTSSPRAPPIRTGIAATTCGNAGSWRGERRRAAPVCRIVRRIPMSSTSDIQAKWQERKNSGLDLGAAVRRRARRGMGRTGPGLSEWPNLLAPGYRDARSSRSGPDKVSAMGRCWQQPGDQPARIRFSDVGRIANAREDMRSAVSSGGRSIRYRGLEP